MRRQELCALEDQLSQESQQDVGLLPTLLQKAILRVVYQLPLSPEVDELAVLRDCDQLILGDRVGVVLRRKLEGVPEHSEAKLPTRPESGLEECLELEVILVEAFLVAFLIEDPSGNAGIAPFA